jgi:ComF family protein
MVGFDNAYSYGSYEGVLRRLIQLFKYERIDTLAAPLGRFLLNGLPRDLRFDCLVPVPLHWRRKWSRGFNQAELLARVLGRHTALPVLAKTLQRRRSTQAQAGLSDAERRANTEGAFTVPDKRRPDLSGKHVLLIDDVLTTGATLSAASRALRRAGARRVTVLTVARADRRSQWSLLDHEGLSPARQTGRFDDTQIESTEHKEGTRAS